MTESTATFNESMSYTITSALIKRGERTQPWGIFCGGEKEHQRKILPALGCCDLTQVKKKVREQHKRLQGECCGWTSVLQLKFALAGYKEK